MLLPPIFRACYPLPMPPCQSFRTTLPLLQLEWCSSTMTLTREIGRATSSKWEEPILSVLADRGTSVRGCWRGGTEEEDACRHWLDLWVSASRGRGSWAGPLCAPMGKEGGITTAREQEHGEGREMWAQRYEKVGKKSGGNKTIWFSWQKRSPNCDFMGLRDIKSFN
jgi:hypothetical protein